MIKIFKNNEYKYISLQEYINEFHSSINQSWYQYLELINEGMNIDNDYKIFLKKMNLKKYNFSYVNKKHQNLKSSGISEYLDDDILKFISHLFEIGYFKRIGQPDLCSWLKTRNVFSPNRGKINGGYSIMELIILENGNYAVKNILLNALKW